jgi:hypothetical protein
MKRTTSDTEAEVLAPKKKTKRNSTKLSTTTSSLTCLEAFFANFFFNAVIQTDPAVVKLAYDKNVSRKLISMYSIPFPPLPSPHISSLTNLSVDGIPQTSTKT